LTTDQKVRGSSPLGRVVFREVAQLGRAPGLGPGGRRFESCLPDFGALAQLGERLLCTQEVSGSIPLGSIMEEYPSPAEGIGLENRQAVRAARGFESLFLRHLNIGPVV
jgi:hypothetical protein